MTILGAKGKGFWDIVRTVVSVMTEITDNADTASLFPHGL
jgi:hypothetical protein